MTSVPDIQSDVRRAMSAQESVYARLLLFQAACANGRWDDAEVLRAEILASLDAFMDNLAAIYKRMESE